MSSLEEAVRLRAAGRCEYCLVPQAAFRRSFHIEHIVARQHGGASDLANLALACWNCNFRKGPNLASIDSESGFVTPLLHPRRDSWTSHFSALVVRVSPPGIAIVGLTPAGRATAQLLNFNEGIRQILRYEFWLEGLLEADEQTRGAVVYR